MIDRMDEKTWNHIVASFPDPHILQTWQWARVKSQFGWEPIYKVWGNPENPDAAALILKRTISIGGFAARLRILYAPKGPLLRNWDDRDLREKVLSHLKIIANKEGAIFIKIDPDVPLGGGIPDADGSIDDPVGFELEEVLRTHGWQSSDDQIQFRNTALIDLTPPEDEILARMKQKTRYNVRLAGRKGVSVRPGTADDFDLLYKMYAETSVRDGFVIRSGDYYKVLWRTFLEAGMLEPLIAEVEGGPVAAVVIFRFAERAYYMHGMSRATHRNKMPNYLLQWEAMRRAKDTGCKIYDLWGAPEVFDESDSMWGVFRFKQGLGGEVQRTIGAYDLPVKPLYYKLYTQVLPGKCYLELKLIDNSLIFFCE